MTGLSRNIVIRPGPGKLVLTGLAPRVQIRHELEATTKIWLWRDQSADPHELPLPVLCGSRHDPLRSPVVDPRCFGGSVDRRSQSRRAVCGHAAWYQLGFVLAAVSIQSCLGG